MRVERATADDAPALAALFTTSVHGLAAPHYNKAQRAAWAPRPPDPAAWRRRLEGLQAWVARDGSQLAGFIACTADGGIDLLFTSPAHARRGVASGLLQHAERALVAGGVEVLTVHASRVAEPFFVHHGFKTSAREVVRRRGACLPRLAMERPAVASKPQ